MNCSVDATPAEKGCVCSIHDCVDWLVCDVALDYGKSFDQSLVRTDRDFPDQTGSNGLAMRMPVMLLMCSRYSGKG